MTHQPQEYWSEVRKPLPCLMFLIPWIAVYEAGVLMLAESDPNTVRGGADYWLRSVLGSVGLDQFLLLPVLVTGVLVTWHLLRRYPWRLRPETLVGMLAESFVLAVALVAVGQVHQVIFLSLGTLHSQAHLLMLSTGALTKAVGFIGAGVYEEVMFRLLLVPATYGVFRLLDFSTRGSAVMAAVLTALVFALAHHVGPSADAFNLFAFSFRAAAGAFFATIFFLRGFGITVGCHAVYDLLVGVLLAGPTPGH